MNALNILFGPPKKEEERTILSFFFSLPGKHFVCGGTTSNIVSAYLSKPLIIDLVYVLKDIPPIGEMEGCDLVTEGVITMRRVKRLLSGEDKPDKDGASLICSAMQEAETINFVCGVLSEEKKALLSEIMLLLGKSEKQVKVFSDNILV